MNCMTTQNMIKNKRVSSCPETQKKEKSIAHEVIALSTNHIPGIDFSQC